LTAPPERFALPAESTWNLADLHRSEAAWRAEREQLVADLPALERWRGTLAASAAELRGALDLAFDLRRRLNRLYVYASLRADEDTRRSAPLAQRQEIQQLATDLAARAAWLEPEILRLAPGTIERFLAAEPGLAPYRHFLDDLLRRKEHTGSAGEEKILAEAGLVADAPATIHELFVDADLPRPEVVLSTGERVALDPSSFARHRASPVRADRRQVCAAFFGRLHDFRRTFGATLDAGVKRNVFFARARRYGSALERALDADAIPVAIYRNLVAQVNDHLPTFHRYLALRRKILGVEELSYFDLYAPLLSEVDREFDFGEALALVAEAFAPLGEEVRALAERAGRERWIDPFPSPGKRSGAYSNGLAYGVHPFVLLNYNRRYDDVSTLAHELGHALHSFLSNRTQPYPTARYSIFVAEVASTLAEALLLDRMLAGERDPGRRLQLLGRFLEGVKGTLFRQTQFAEFELRIHETVERGEALTGDALDALYLALARRYYGHEEGVCSVGDEVASEWAYVPHFYYDFYVYQYATSFTASTALAEELLAGGATAAAARRRTLELLSAGGSDYPVALLARAGVDLTTPAPFAATIAKANRVMDEVERLFERLNAPARSPDAGG
jgi:oligoendopeptidase F